MKRKKLIKWCLCVIVCIGLFAGGIVCWVYNSPDTVPVSHSLKARLYWHTNVNPWSLGQVRDYCRKFGYNEDYYIICDFGRVSGKKRFFLYDLNDLSHIMSSYCMHGDGSGSTAEKPVFSNRVGSNCSSLGLFALKGIGSPKIKNSIHLVGLDLSNSNAYSRGLLIHSSMKTTVFRGETDYIPLGVESHGCFTISADCLIRLMSIYHLHGKRKRILMWACYQ